MFWLLEKLTLPSSLLSAPLQGVIMCLSFGDHEVDNPSTPHKFLNYVAQVSMPINLLCNHDRFLCITTCLSCQQAAKNKQQRTCLSSHERVCRAESPHFPGPTPTTHTTLPAITTHSPGKEELVARADRRLHRSVLRSSYLQSLYLLALLTSHLPPSQ